MQARVVSAVGCTLPPGIADRRAAVVGPPRVVCLSTPPHTWGGSAQSNAIVARPTDTGLVSEPDSWTRYALCGGQGSGKAGEMG